MSELKTVQTGGVEGANMGTHAVIVFETTVLSPSLGARHLPAFTVSAKTPEARLLEKSAR